MISPEAKKSRLHNHKETNDLSASSVITSESEVSANWDTYGGFDTEDDRPLSQLSSKDPVNNTKATKRKTSLLRKTLTRRNLIAL